MAFSTFAWTGQGRPMAPKPPPAPQHAHDTAPETAWTVPPAGTGQGFSDPQPVDPLMNARGISRDLSIAYGHNGTALTARALAPVGGANATETHNRYTGQARAAAAHGDRRLIRAQTHAYNPGAQGQMGDGQSVDWAEGHGGVGIPAMALVKSRVGGAFSDGAAGEIAPTGFRLGNSRRWAARSYTSPALGAMYSRNSLRGVLPQVVASPVNQPGLIGPLESGIASNARFLAKFAVTPKIWQSPRTASDIAIAAQAGQSGYAPMLGTGMM